MTPPADPWATLRALVEAGERITEALTNLGEIHGYGLLRTEDPRDFRPDENECTPEELANHRAAVEAVERGEPVPDQPFTPDAVTIVDGVAVHSCGGPWGIGSYVVRDPELLAMRDVFDAARPALAAIAGKVWLDVDVAKMLVKAARETMELCDAIDRHHVEPENNRSAGAYADKIDAALAAAEAEVRRCEGR